MRRQSLFRSIRTRLTAWYAISLLLIVLLLGAGVSWALERQLRQDVDQRLRDTGAEMTAQFDVAFQFNRPTLIVPPPDAFSFPSQLIQVVDNSGQIWFRSENLGDDRELPFALDPAREGDLLYDTIALEGTSIRTLAYPIEIQGRTVGAVIVGEPLIQLTETLDNLRRQFLFAALAGAALAGLGGWFLAGRALRPVGQMTDTARRIVASTGDTLPLETRLQFPRSGDEIAKLGETFNDLLDRLQTALDQQRRFVADASHELRTPLTAVQGNIDLLEKQLDRAQHASSITDETLEELRRESKRMARLVADLLTLARLESAADLALVLERQALLPIAEDAVRLASALHPECQFDLDANMTPDAVVDRDRIEQVIVILLDNAARHTEPGSPVRITVSERASDALIEVSDRGAGIPAEDLPHIFDRFYRADTSRGRARGGTGLGLAIAQAVTKAHGGTIEIASEVGRGTRVTVTLLRNGPAAGRL